MAEKAKAFDCVEMKNAIQARLHDEQDGLSEPEVWARARRRLESLDTPVGEIWRSLSCATATTAEE